MQNSRLSFDKRELQLDIHMDGQVLPPGWAKVLTKSLSIFLNLIETDGKLCQNTSSEPASVQTLIFTHRYGVKIFSSMFQYHCLSRYYRCSTLPDINAGAGMGTLKYLLRGVISALGKRF